MSGTNKQPKMKELKTKIGNISNSVFRKMDLKSALPQVESGSDQQNIRVSAFFLLSHAVFEEFIEVVCNNIIAQHESLYREGKKCSRVLFNICVFYSINLSKSFIDKHCSNSDAIVSHCVSEYKQTISNNHGISKSNFEKLFGPFGISMNDLASDGEYGSINSFAKKRGLFAHRIGPSHHVSVTAARDEVDRVSELVFKIAEKAWELSDPQRIRRSK